MSYAGIIASSRMRTTSMMRLSYTATTSLNLNLLTISGQDVQIDWGDGVWETYASSTTLRTKTFATATSGVARVRSAVGNPKSDIYYIRSTDGTWSFDIIELSNVTYLNITGQNTLTGLIDNAPVGLTYLNIQGQNTLTYTGRQWVENQNRHLFRATQFNSQMVDHYLIDLSAVTIWVGTKAVDLRVGVSPTPASASAIATLESRGVTVLTS